MHPAVTRAAQRANGGSIPSLRTVNFDAPEAPTAGRPPPNREATGSIPVRRAVSDRDDVAERQRRGVATSADAGSIPAVVFP